MAFNKKLNDFQEHLFDLFVFISYFLIILSSLGLSYIAPKFLNSLDYYVRIYICLFLMWRFNPFRDIDRFTELDRKVAFSAGLFIITTTALNKYLVQFKEYIKHFFN